MSSHHRILSIQYTHCAWAVQQMAQTNDAQKRKGPVLDPALCRCCRTIKKCRLLTKEYEWLGNKEVYSDMIMDCFGLLLSHLDGDDKDNCICATCVVRLREASAFRKQVLYWEEALLQAKLELQKDDGKPQVEVKVEPGNASEDDDDTGSRGDPWPDGGFQNVSDSEDAKALSELKIEKTETELKKPKLKKVITRKIQPIDKSKKDLLLKKKLLSEMKKTKSKLFKQKQGAEVDNRRDAESIVQYTTAYPFRIPRGNSLIECVYCRTLFAEPKKFRSHMEAKHKTFKLEMSFARISFTSDFGKVDISDLRCRLCNKDFKKMDAIAVHLKTEHDVKLSTDITKGNLMPYKLERMAHRCGICDAAFLYVREVSKHMSTHFGRFTCELCGKCYPKEPTLAAHMLFSHNPKKVCAMCRTGFDTQEERTAHIRSSKECYPFCCCDCGERFLVKRQKEAHKEKVHGHKRSWPCGKCSKVFPDSRKLTEHFTVAHSDRFYACPHCDRKCHNKKRFDDHMLGHTKEAMFTCNVCSKSFPRKRALEMHKWNHIEKKRFECADCDKKFNQRVSWKTHMKRYHPDVDI